MSSTNSVKRVLVALNESDNLVKFNQCIVSSLNQNANTAFVTCELKSETLILKKSNENQPNSILLEHPPFCPMLSVNPSDIDPETLKRGVNTGVCTILESSDNHLLLTRRAAHMRTFPGVWVPPGGGIDLEDQSLLETGLRELSEETGLKDLKIKKWEIMCLWESVYPYTLTMGLPKRHHIVVYLNIIANETRECMEAKMNLDPQEVDAATWLPLHLVDIVINGNNAKDAHLDNQETFKIMSLNKDKKLIFKNVSVDVLLTKAPKSGEDKERLTTGTLYALTNWLKLKKQ